MRSDTKKTSGMSWLIRTAVKPNFLLYCGDHAQDDVLPDGVLACRRLVEKDHRRFGDERPARAALFCMPPDSSAGYLSAASEAPSVRSASLPFRSISARVRDVVWMRGRATFSKTVIGARARCAGRDS